MTPAQNKRLNGLLKKTNNVKNKANLVFGFTGGRSESRKDLTYSEAEAMINHLNSFVQQDSSTGSEPANKMRRKIISMAHEMHWHLPGTQKVDMLRLNGWCIHYGYLHKKLNDYTYLELPKLVIQFTEMYNDYLNKI